MDRESVDMLEHMGREYDGYYFSGPAGEWCVKHVCEIAIAEIERLRKQVDRLRFELQRAHMRGYRDTRKCTGF